MRLTQSPQNQPVTLLVEDKSRLTGRAPAILEHSGYRVTFAATANEAIAHLEQDRSIETLVTDISLGSGPTGIDLARDVSQRWPTIGIVVTSGSTILDCANLPQGCLFLPKPYRPLELLVLVSSFHDNPGIVEELRTN